VRQPARRPKGIPLRTLLPNAITALALCSGLFGIRYGIAGEWEKAAGAIVLAAFLDVMDGRIARLLKGQSRFGAELDSLSDVTAFGVAPAIILYQWMLAAIGPGEAAYEYWARYGWLLALGHAACGALRLARFNANIDVLDQPHKSAGFLTGIPAPAGAGLALLPLFLWLWTGSEIFHEPAARCPLGGLGRFPDGIEPRHLLMGFAEAAKPCALRRAGGHRPDRRRSHLGAVADTERGGDPLRGIHPVQHPKLRAGQEAARCCSGIARTTTCRGRALGRPRGPHGRADLRIGTSPRSAARISCQYSRTVRWMSAAAPVSTSAKKSAAAI
jgi:CDP-diacylglycerol--serine O-phosphatidyltransferase